MLIFKNNCLFVYLRTIIIYFNENFGDNGGFNNYSYFFKFINYFISVYAFIYKDLIVLFFGIFCRSLYNYYLLKSGIVVLFFLIKIYFNIDILNILYIF